MVGVLGGLSVEDLRRSGRVEVEEVEVEGLRVWGLGVGVDGPGAGAWYCPSSVGDDGAGASSC